MIASFYNPAIKATTILISKTVAKTMNSHEFLRLNISLNVNLNVIILSSLLQNACSLESCGFCCHPICIRSLSTHLAGLTEMRPYHLYPSHFSCSSIHICSRMLFTKATALPLWTHGRTVILIICPYSKDYKVSETELATVVLLLPVQLRFTFNAIRLGKLKTVPPCIGHISKESRNRHEC